MSELTTRMAQRLTAVKERMAEAARAAGRTPAAVKLVAVTKYGSLAETAALVEVGCHDLGESRPQTLWEKAAALPRDEVRWHLVGHLQRNKIRRTLPLVSLVHSADSLRLIEALDKEARAIERVVPILIQVNTSGEAAKHGFEPAEIEPLLPLLTQYDHLAVQGLMTMAARQGGHDVAQRNFATLRELRDRLEPNCPEKISLQELSMGMSGDYEVAIREGATLVRIGSALFEDA